MSSPSRPLASALLGAAVLAALLPTPARGQQVRTAPPPGGPQHVVESIEAMRGGLHVDVLRLAELPGFDFSTLSWSRDPVLVVDGMPITQEDLKRGLCLLAGANEIEKFISLVLGRQVEERLKAEGLDPASWSVTDDDLKKKYEEQRPYAAQAAGMSEQEYDQYIAENGGWEQYMELMRVQSRFERLFMPKPPEGFLEQQNVQFQQMLVAWNQKKAEVEQHNREESQKAAQEGREPQIQPLPPAPRPDADLSFLPSFLGEYLEKDWMEMVRDFYARGMEVPPVMRGGVANVIRDTLLKKHPVLFWEELPAGVQPGVLFQIDTTTVTVDDVYKLLEPRLTDAMRVLTLRELLMLRGADRALARDGWLPTNEQAEQRFNDMAAQYENSILPLPHAVMLRGFQSVWHYKRYWRRKGAYHDMLEATLPEEKLREHYEKAGAVFFAQGGARGHVLFVPGTDRAATEAAMAAALARVAGGEAIAAVAKEAGSWTAVPDSADGSFQRLVRNRLRNLLEESEYTTFATGYSLADEAFYHAREGSVVGPVFRNWGTKLVGCLALRVDQFATGATPLPFAQVRPTVLEDYSDLYFPRYALEALLECEITMPPGP